MIGLVGHSGFVGGELMRQWRFDATFNSANAQDLAGASFGTLVCAAAPGSMLQANRQPDVDRARIDALIGTLRATRADRFILISSIAVLADFAAGDDEGTQAFQTDLAYGRHRRALEQACADHFPHCLVVRLPALFGRGLKKNFLFDLMNPLPSLLPPDRLANLRAALPSPLGDAVAALYHPDAASGLLQIDRRALAAHPQRVRMEQAAEAAGFSAVRFHNPDTTYQFYRLSRLGADLQTALQAGLSVLHLATQPLRAATIHAHLLGQPMPPSTARLHREDMHTRHAGLWGRTGPYLAQGDEILTELSAFLATARGAP